MMDVRLSDLRQYYGDNKDILWLVHGTLIILIIGLIVDMMINIRHERANRIKLTVREGTYMNYVFRDIKLLFAIFIIYLLIAPLLWGFIKLF